MIGRHESWHVLLQRKPLCFVGKVENLVGTEELNLFSHVAEKNE